MSDSGPTDPWGNPIPNPQVPPQVAPHAPDQPFFPPDPGAGPPLPGWQPAERAPAPGGYPYPQYGTPPHFGPPRTEGTAIGALVCGLVGLLVCGIILEPVAIVLGFQARKKIGNSNGALKGEGMALAGIVLGFVGLALAIVGIVIFITNPDFVDNLFPTTTSTAG